MKNKIQLIGTLFFLLSLSILATIYLAWIFYPIEISKLNLTDFINLSNQQVQTNFNVLMQYLTLPWINQLSMPDLVSSTDGLHHFYSVKWLFHLTQAVFLVTIPSIFYYVKKQVKNGYAWLNRQYFLVMALLPLIIALVAFLIGFEQFFISFHKILFVGDSTWLFDPRVDPVILILPETFFLHCFIVFFILHQIISWGFWLVVRSSKKR